MCQLQTACTAYKLPLVPPCICRGRSQDRGTPRRAGRPRGGHFIHWCHVLIHQSGHAHANTHTDSQTEKKLKKNPIIPQEQHRSLRHTHTQRDDLGATTYFSSFQQDLSLLLVFPLLLHPLQLLKEAELRADVRRLLVALVVLAGRWRKYHCDGNS